MGGGYCRAMALEQSPALGEQGSPAHKSRPEVWWQPWDSSGTFGRGLALGVR